MLIKCPKILGKSFHTVCYPCEPGYYQPETGQFSCKACSPGFYCDGETVKHPCVEDLIEIYINNLLYNKNNNFYVYIKKVLIVQKHHNIRYHAQMGPIKTFQNNQALIYTSKDLIKKNVLLFD